MSVSLKEEVYIPLWAEDVLQNDGTRISGYYDSYPDDQRGFKKRYPAGLCCPCNGKIYENRLKFKLHLDNKRHSSWLKRLKDENGDMHIELIKARDTIKQQQKIITSLSNYVSKLELENASLKVPVANLLE